MELNRKPIVIDTINMALGHMHAPLRRIMRISTGLVGSPSQVEDIELHYKDGTIERFSILEMSPEDAFMAICESLVKHTEVENEKES